MFNTQLEEHIAHSAPCASQWDGFDCGDRYNDRYNDHADDYDVDLDESNLTRDCVTGCEPVAHDAQYDAYRAALGLDDIEF